MLRKKIVNLIIIAVSIVIQQQVLYAQTGEVSGKVTDSSGQPLSSASVRLKNTKKITVTDQNGFFHLSGSFPNTLQISMAGYTTREVTVHAGEKLTVQMTQESNALNDVVVTALGIKKEKRDLTFSSQVVTGDNLVQAKEPSLLNSMTGKVAGVQITSSNGMPGSSSSIVIRGITSLSGDNQALIVLDGVPINNDETDGPYDGGSGSNRLNDIDPSIVESINVLKGAAATALYGSAGARGVVLITTKKGSAMQHPRVTLSLNGSLENAILPERQYKYAQGDAGVYYDGDINKTSTSWGPEIDTLYYNGKKVQFHNPFKDFFQTGNTKNASLTVEGGNDKDNYVLGYALVNQKGTVPNTDYIRQNLFGKFNVNIAKNLSAIAQISYSDAHNNIMPQGYGIVSPLSTIYSAPVSYNFKPVLDSNGDQRLYRSAARDNPYWILDNVLNKSVVNRFLPEITINWQPADWITVTERAGADIYTDQLTYHVNQGDVTYPTGLAENSNYNFRQYNNDLIVTLKKDFSSRLKSSLVLGNNIFSNYGETMTMVGRDLASAGYYNIASAASVTSTESSYLSRKIGFYGQAEIDYDKYLIFNLTGRYDGTSVLSSGNRYYPYGSAAVAFIFSELLPASTKKVIDFGKFRVSYASVGNDNVSAYATTTPYYQASIGGALNSITFPYSGQNGFLISSALGNPDLKNELLKEFETGLEMKFFQDLVGFELSYFHRNVSQGLMANAQLPYSTGYSTTTLNSAKLHTNGLELLVNASPVRTKNFRWDMTINFTKTKTIVDEIGNGLDQVEIGFVYATKGHQFGDYYGDNYARNDKGQLLTSDGLPYSDGNSEIIGNISPNWLGGIQNTFRYKQLSLSFLLDVKNGGQVQNTNEYYDLFYGTSVRTLNRKDMVVDGIDATTGEKNTTSVSSQSYWQNASYIASEQIQNASYVKLRNVSLTYSISKTKWKSMPFNGIDITLTGKNIWIGKSKSFTEGDPEATNSWGTANGSIGNISYEVPTSRSYGLSLTFKF